jgi:hypothetical protein
MTRQAIERPNVRADLAKVLRSLFNKGSKFEPPRAGHGSF